MLHISQIRHLKILNKAHSALHDLIAQYDVSQAKHRNLQDALAECEETILTNTRARHCESCETKLDRDEHQLCHDCTNHSTESA
ncbi:MAG: hypothetical protein OXB94_11115 [Nitrospira sp.]|nr:hypothetical protein [Nitrospira sp.]